MQQIIADPVGAARNTLAGLADMQRNRLGQMAGPAPFNPAGQRQQNALATYGGPTNAAASAMVDHDHSQHAGQTHGEWLRYANQSAIRNKPLSENLVSALSFLPELGIEMEVFSGGQDEKGSGGARTGSIRHDHGDAADVLFFKDGRKLDWANPEDLPVFEEIVRRGRSNGITGIGAGDGYMRPGSMHIGFGAEAVWGAGGSGANAPEWLRRAYG